MVQQLAKDSVWNFLSDLGPILNLFGEGITKQFLSGSLYLEDHILLATLPIGIITITVSAIRVAGPTWLKAIVGRASEARGKIELELMTSTSQFVCELWDGQAMVRVLATSPVREVIYIKGPGHDFFKLEDTLKRKLLVPKTAKSSILWGWVPCPRPINQGPGPYKTQSLNKLDPYRSLRPGQTRVPNVILNAGGSATEKTLCLATCFGLLVQFSVLAAMYLISYTRFLEFGQQRATGTSSILPIPTYIFCLATAGTLAISLGVFICSKVIDSSTIETNYMLNAGVERELLVFWIQKGGAINDQDFGSYAIFPRERQHSLISSHPRNYTRDQAAFDEVVHADMINPIAGEDQASIITGTTAAAIAGSFLALVGFIIQLIGLRAMPVAAPLAVQVGTAFMLVLRIFVRRNSGINPHIVVLPARFELDKLALDFAQAGHPDAFWLKLNGKSSSTGLHGGGDTVVDAGDPEAPISDHSDRTQMSFTVVGQDKHSTPVRWDSSSPSPPLLQKAIEIREGLGRVTGMSSGAAPLATHALRCAIEGIMDYLFPGSDRAKQQRQRPLDLYKPKAQAAIYDRTHRAHSNVGDGSSKPSRKVSFPLRIETKLSASKEPQTQQYEIIIEDLPGYGWYANYSQLEAILSLSCYTMQRHCATSHLYEVTPQSSTNAPENIVLDLLGDASSNNALVRWWIKAYTDSLLQVSCTSFSANEVASIPTCPKTGENTFRILASNVIKTGHNEALYPCNDNTDPAWLKFAFRRHGNYSDEELELEDFNIDSRKVYVPVTKPSLPDGQDIQPHDAKPDRAHTDRGWILATISVTPLEFATAQTIYACFLNSLFASKKTRNTIQKLIATSATRVSTAPHPRKDEFNVYNFLERDCRLQNDVIDRLLNVVRESGLYEGGSGGDLRVVSALAHADLLPAAIDTDRLLEFTREKLGMITSDAERDEHSGALSFWLATHGTHREIGDTQLLSAVVHCLEFLLNMFRRRCVEESQGLPMSGGPWVQDGLSKSSRHVLELESQASRNLGLEYGAVSEWLASEERGASQKAEAIISGRLSQRTEVEQKKLTKFAKDLTAYCLREQKTRNHHGWEILCGAVSSISCGEFQTSAQEHRHLPTSQHPIIVPFQSIKGDRAREFFDICDSEGQDQRSRDELTDWWTKIRYLPTFSVPESDSRSWVPFHFSTHEGTSEITPAPNNHKVSELHCAVASGNLEMVKLALEEMKNKGSSCPLSKIDFADEFCRTPLHLAVSGGYEEIVKELVQMGANIYSPDEWGRNPVHLAIAVGRQDILEALLNSKSTSSTPEGPGKRNIVFGINSVDAWGYAAIHYAVLSNNEHIIQIICEEDGFELLHLRPTGGLARHEQQATRRIPIAINQSTNLRLTVPVTHLCNTLATLERLLKATHALTNGADILEQDSTERTLLHAAAELPALDIVDSLLSTPKFASMLESNSMLDYRQKSPLHLAATRDILTALLRNDTLRLLVNKQDKWGCSALHDATAYGREGVVEGLIAAGADITIRDNLDRTALHYACLLSPASITETTTKIVRQLAKPIALMLRDKKQKTALDYAESVPGLLLELQNCQKQHQTARPT